MLYLNIESPQCLHHKLTHSLFAFTKVVRTLRNIPTIQYVLWYILLYAFTFWIQNLCKRCYLHLRVQETEAERWEMTWPQLHSLCVQSSNLNSEAYTWKSYPQGLWHCFHKLNRFEIFISMHFSPRNCPYHAWCICFRGFYFSVDIRAVTLL